MSDFAVQDKPKLGHPDTSTIFVLGLLSLVFFPFGLCAWYFGNRLLREYDAEPNRWGRRQWVEAGKIIGIVGLVLNGLLFLVSLGLNVAI